MRKIREKKNNQTYQNETMIKSNPGCFIIFSTNDDCYFYCTYSLWYFSQKIHVNCTILSSENQ